jgi:hypothetical protein
VKIRRSERPRATPKPRVRKLSQDELEIRDFMLGAEPGVYRVSWAHDVRLEYVKRLVNEAAREHARVTHWAPNRRPVVRIEAHAER